MRKFFVYGGFIAGAVLVVFGVAVIGLGVNARSTVHSNLSQEAIVGSADMTPAQIKQEVEGQSWAANVTLPTCDVAGHSIDTGSEARCFASYMRIHALTASGGLTYSQLPRYATADGKGTNDAMKALRGDNGQPVSNALRSTWIDETALSTALNVSYMAEQLSLFSIVIGIALLLTGIGFVILDWVALHRRRVAEEAKASAAHQAGKPVTA